MFVKSEDRKMRAAIHSVLILCSQKWYQFLSMVCLVSYRFLPGGWEVGGGWEGEAGRPSMGWILTSCSGALPVWLLIPFRY